MDIGTYVIEGMLFCEETTCLVSNMLHIINLDALGALLTFDAISFLNQIGFICDVNDGNVNSSGLWTKLVRIFSPSADLNQNLVPVSNKSPNRTHTATLNP